MQSIFNCQNEVNTVHTFMNDFLSLVLANEKRVSLVHCINNLKGRDLLILLTINQDYSLGHQWYQLMSPT